jgi:hypothetical protein
MTTPRPVWMDRRRRSPADPLNAVVLGAMVGTFLFLLLALALG